MDQDSDIWSNRFLTLNRIWRLVSAVGETTASGEVGLLRDTVEEYFPLGVGVYDIDIEDKTGSCEKKQSRHVTSRKGPDNKPISVGKYVKNEFPVEVILEEIEGSQDDVCKFQVPP